MATRVRVSGIFGLTAGMHSRAPGGWGAIRFGKAPWKTGQPSIFQQHPPVRHRGRDARYDAAALSDDAFAVRVLLADPDYGVRLRFKPTRSL
jgi:hypothetical protein